MLILVHLLLKLFLVLLTLIAVFNSLKTVVVHSVEGGSLFISNLQAILTLQHSTQRWEDGIRMDLIQIGWGSVDWIQLAQDRERWRAVVNTVMNLRVLAPRI
jgi:hypothetical protein